MYMERRPGRVNRDPDAHRLDEARRQEARERKHREALESIGMSPESAASLVSTEKSERLVDVMLAEDYEVFDETGLVR